ncbi:MAG: hypothetical protein L0387_40600 [Acidobacteria bacterium]|nr:hypothetical protein [Acidobacteriota bacterium]
MRLRLCALLLMLLSSRAAFAQDPATGFPPYGSFDSSGFESVNLANLNGNAGIPIVQVPGRVPFSFSLVYDSLVWKRSGNAWVRVTDAAGTPTWGWKKEYPTGFISSSFYTEPCGEGPTEISSHSYNYAYTDPAGTIHQFPTIEIDDYTLCGGTRSGVFTGFASDKSGYYIDATLAVEVRAPNGTKVGSDQRVTDTNGNYISRVVVNSSETHWKDTVGRVALKIVKGTNYIDYKFLAPTGVYQTTRLNLQTFNIKTNFACSGVTEYTGTGSLPISVVLPNGRQWSFTYEDTPGFTGYKSGRLKRMTLPTGGYVEYQYPTTGNKGIDCANGTVKTLTKVVNNGTTNATWLYSRSSSTTTVTFPAMPYDSGSNFMTVVYGANGKESSRSIYRYNDSLPYRTITTTYAANDTPATVTTTLEDNQKSKVDTSFDDYGNLLSSTEYDWGAGAVGPALRTTTISYLSTSAYTALNIRDRRTQVIVREGGATGAIKSRTNITYDGVTPTCITGAAQHNDAAYGCSFNTRGNPTAVTTYVTPATPAGPVTKNFTYDSLGNPKEADADCCRKIQWNFSSTTQWNYPDSAVRGAAGGPQLTTSSTYNAHTGLVATTTDENNKVTTLTYDTLKRLTDVQRPDNAHITYTYDDVARTVRVTTPIQGTDVARQTTYLDPLGRAIKQVISDGTGATYSIVETQYDPLGRPYRGSNPHNSTAQYWSETRFDVLGRPTVVIPPDGTATSNNISYSYAGNTGSVTNQAGQQRKQQFDGAGRLSKVYEPDVNNGNALTQESSYTYTVFDTVASRRQGAYTHYLNYDGLGRYTSGTSPEAGSLTFQYNSYSQVTQRNAIGVITTYIYDTLNRPQQVSYNVGATGVPATPTVNYSYGTSAAQNNNGRLLSMTDGPGSESYSYDTLGRVTQVQKVISGTTYTTGYQYNLADELTHITYPSGRVVQQDYDPVGRLTTILSGATSYASTFGYNPAGQVTGFIYGNGVTATYGYTPERLLLSSLGYTKPGQTLFSLSYGYVHPSGGKNGQVTSVTDNVDSARSQSFTYDALGRLKEAQTTNLTAPNTWKLVWTFDLYGSRPTQTQTAGTASAPQPQLTIAANNKRITNSGFLYESRGNLTQEGSASLQYKYDAENQMVDFNNGGTVYSFDGSGQRVKKVTGTTTTVSVFSGSKVIAEYVNGALSKEYVYAGSGLLATLSAAGAPTYHHPDHLSIRVETDSSAAITRTFGHYPYGEVWYETGTVSKWKFTSYERDSESGLDYAIFRYYGPRLGRFMSPDRLAGTLGDPQSLNRYAYVLNDPVNVVDPFGLCGLNDVVDASVRSVDVSSAGIAYCNVLGTFRERIFDLPGFTDPIGEAFARYQRSVDDAFNRANSGGGGAEEPISGVQIDVYCQGEDLGNYACAVAPWSYKYMAPGTGIYRVGWNATAAMFQEVYRRAAGPVYGAAFGTAVVAGGNLAMIASFEAGGPLLIYGETALKADLNHAYPYMYDSVILQTGNVMNVSRAYTLYELAGSLNGVAGTYQLGGYWINTAFVVTHRFFERWR